jgi:NADP-dependent 3-hydroxy acid dehydrogenase YdfG
VREFGRLDVLVANAGIYVPVDFEAMSDRDWQDAIDVDLTGVANSMRAAMPHMVARRSAR